jgi:hypothetical protein
MKTTIAALFLAASAAWAQGNDSQPMCTNATLLGDYGFSVAGTRPSSSYPFAPIETVVGVAMTHFDGNGSLTQTDNIHGSITGARAPDRKGTGTYTVNPDCTGTMKLLNQGAPPLTLRIVIVDDGNEVRAAVVDPTSNPFPGSIMPQVMVTSNGRRVTTHTPPSQTSSAGTESGGGQ